MQDCLFCKIVSKELPSFPVYEDERFYAILDIHPTNPGHTLIISKQHAHNLLDAPEDVTKNILPLAQKISAALCQAMQTDAFNLEMNCGAVAGQIIPHLHLHIVPRFPEDGFKHGPGKTYAAGEAEYIAQRIRESL